jgi:hypothetical protein
MKRLTMGLCVMFAAAAWAQDEDAGTTAKKPGPDISKMAFGADAVKTIVSHHQPEIQRCYESVLANKKNVVEGRINTSWRITTEGLVKDAKVVKKGTTLKNPQLHECVVAALSQMEFPKPPVEQPVEYPFNLKAEK